MNTLINKNISQSQLSNLHRINIDDNESDVDNKTNPSFLYRLTRWLHLIKRWKHESIPEVCKHMYRFSLL
jgi:hypothetical protein